jgi:Flp pilus assembly pilin Flp
VTSVEYAVLLAAILMVIVAAVRYMGNALDRSFNHSGQQMQNAGM